MHRSSALAAASALSLGWVLILGAGPSSAQEALRIGASIDGRLESGDAAASDDEYRFDSYRFQARAGQRLEAIMRSDAFDAYLAVYADGGAGEPLARDDDGLGDGTDARLRFTPETDGTYVLRARNFSGLETGDYSLSLSERPRPPRAPRPGSIRKGGEQAGELTDRDPEQEEGGRYDAYAFRAAQGERFEITLNADDFDPLLRVGRMNGADFEELAHNDDAGGGGLNSRLIFFAPTSGEYIIRATSVREGTGGYTLALNEAPPPPPSKPIALDETVRGVLSEDTPMNDDGARADVYRFSGTAGQRIAVEMKSSDFDTYLTLRNASDMSVLGEDDDGAGAGTDSRLAHVLEADGDYLIEARAFSEGTGDYSLTVTETPPPPPPSAAAFGETMQGEIGEDDPLDASGRRYDAYVFTAVEGQRIQAIMRSGDFDTYLEVGAAGDDDFEALGSDDDGLAEGTDSRLNFTVPDDGDYIVRASPLGSDADGLYSIEIIDRGPAPAPGSLLVGSTARGTLSAADAMTAEGAYFDAYRFQAKAEEKLRLTLVSNAFDAVVEVGPDATGDDFEALETDDDSLSDTHARLDWTAPEDGWFVVRARAYGPNETGAYALTVERQP